MIVMRNAIVLGFISLVSLSGSGCGSRSVPVATTGVRETVAEVQVGSDGLTAEQRNIRERLKRDNTPGAIKHLYVISPVSGQCILYSTVREKVTSSGKRLTPTSVLANDRFSTDKFGIDFKLGDKWQRTTEVLQDDGTYGGSIEYLYWFDQAGNYRQLYPSAGVMIVVSETPLPIKSVIQFN
jgi:hypothetical protein